MRPVRFAARCEWNTEETEWARLLRERRGAGQPVLDLTASNPTRCGFEYGSLLPALTHPAALIYDPDPLGMRAAREAVVAYYREHAFALQVPLELERDQVVLTTSTSEAYSFLFRLLCDPGDEVLIAQPSYPLFDFLAALDDVRLRPYPLFYDYGWHIDTHALRKAVSERTRAIVVVHPNNPTGHYTPPAERQDLERLCVEHRLALIVDEVFLDYPIGGNGSASFLNGEHPALTFVLSGLSKIAALPQMKAAWLACAGPERVLRGALSRLEVIADTFLSMNAPVQCALPAWLGHSAAIRRQIRSRVQANLAALDDLLEQQQAVNRLTVEAGWYAVLRVPAVERGDELALRLLLEQGVAVHPGEYFGFAESGWLVVSLLGPLQEFAAGVRRLLAAVASGVAANPAPAGDSGQ